MGFALDGPEKPATHQWSRVTSTHIGHELIAAGMLILAGGGRGLPLDYDELERWTRVGYERGTRSRNGSANQDVGKPACSGKGTTEPRREIPRALLSWLGSRSFNDLNVRLTGRI